ncbi:MAG: A/G-specific adenine glycosylase [Chitinophagales bacterium]
MIWFSNILLEWYNPTTRKLPWKKTNDAYKIWISEIILQQTRVEQGMPYYLAFIKNYPTVKQLANAPLDDVLKLWEGLGYYSRARNLHTAARQVMENHNGKFPCSHEEMLQLKGIGKYTAAAIASFAFQLPHAVVDGNVYRVLTRVFGIHIPIDTAKGKQQIEQLAHELLDKLQPHIYNQAIMDFGALVCKPQQPLCSTCPFVSNCKAYLKNEINSLPVKSKKIVKTNRFFHYFILFDTVSIYIQQRDGNDIWKGLHEFPLVETKSEDSQAEIKIWLQEIGIKSVQPVLISKQILSHQNIYANFYELKWKNLPNLEKMYIKIKMTDINQYAFPKIIRSYLQDRFIFLS